MGKITNDAKYPLFSTLKDADLILVIQDGVLGKIPASLAKLPKRLTIGSNTVLTPEQISGTLIVVTASCTLTLPSASNFSPLQDVASAIIYVDGDYTVHVDPSGSDRIILDGASLESGHKISSPGTAGAYIVIVAESENGYLTIGRNGSWIDGGA